MPRKKDKWTSGSMVGAGVDHAEALQGCRRTVRYILARERGVDIAGARTGANTYTGMRQARVEATGLPILVEGKSRGLQETALSS